FKFKIKDFIQDLLKIQVAQKKVKIAYENADSSSRVDLIPSKIKYAIKVVLRFHIEFSVFLSLSRKENNGLLQDQVFKNKEEVVINVTYKNRATSREQPPLEDKSIWSDQEKKIRKIDRLSRSLLIQGFPNDIYSLIDSNKTANDLWDALETHMLGSEYGEQDRKAVPEWKQCATIMRQNKNLLDINIDALYNISDPLTLVVEPTKVSKRKEKVVVSLESERSDDELKKITALLAKAFNQKKFYSKPTNNNLRTSLATSSVDKKEEKKVDEKKRDMRKVKCYNCKKEGHFSKDYKKAKVKDVSPLE
nr:hypothetical protein [Tanacetum cinerariifolium]